MSLYIRENSFSYSQGNKFFLNEKKLIPIIICYNAIIIFITRRKMKKYRNLYIENEKVYL